MAASFTASADGLIRTTGIAPISGDFTASGLVYIPGAAGVLYFPTIFAQLDDAGTYTDYVWVGYRGTGNTLELAIGGEASEFGEDITPGWHEWAYTRSGTTHKVYLDRVLSITKTKDVSGFTIGEEYLATDSIADDWRPSAHELVREWTAALSLAELIDEWDSATPVRTSGLWLDTPLASDLQDDSGNGRHWTATGSVAYVTRGTVSGVEHPTASTAYALTPGTDITIPAFESTTDDIWFSYVALPGDTVLGLWAHIAVGAGTADLSIYSGTPSSLIDHVQGNPWSTNKPVQFPVTVGTEYFFKVEASAAVEILVSLVRAPAEEVQRGDLYINDDTEGFPAIVLDPSDGSVRRFVTPFPNGEAGDSLADGTLIFEDAANDTVLVYSADFELLATLVITSARIRANAGADKFYVVEDKANPTISVVLPDGSIESTQATTIARPQAIAAANDESVLYHAGTASGSAISVWDLVGETAASDLVAGVSGYFIVDILVLADDTIVASYVKTSAPDDVQVRRYNAAGTLLNTYNFGTGYRYPSGTFPRLSYGLDFETSFWIWTHTTVGLSRLREIQVSDGSVLTDTGTRIEYETGLYEGDDTDDPLDRFGPSYSCPLVLLRPGDEGIIGPIAWVLFPREVP